VIKQSLYVPRHNSALAAIQRDLEALMARQEEFRSQNGRYAANFSELEFYASPGTTIHMTPGALGWSAVATRDEFKRGSEICGAIRVGDGAGKFQEKPEGKFFTYFPGENAAG